MVSKYIQSDYVFKNNNGTIQINDETNGETRFAINTDGHVDITGKGTEKAVELPEPDHGVMVYSKHENAKLHYNTKVQPNLYNTAQKMVDDLFGYEQIGYEGVEDGDTWTNGTGVTVIH